MSLVTSAVGATHVTATYSLGQNPRVMTTVNGQPQYGLVFAQRNKPVTYNNVEYGMTVIYGYLDANGDLNDGAGNLWLDLIPNLGATPADGYYVVTFNIQGQVHAEIWAVPDQATVAAEVCRQAQPPSATAPALFYQFLQEDGIDLPQRQKLNFAGAGVVCLDNAGQLRTDCTFSGGGSGSAPIASATISGTVKTDQTIADPVVYLTTSADSLLAGKADAAHTHSEADVTNLVTDLAAKVPTSRSINTSAPLAGGGALTSDLTLTCATCEVTGNRNAANGYAGLDASTKLASAQLPNPAVASKGGVEALACSGTDKLSAIGTDGIPICSADQTGGAGGGYDTLKGDSGTASKTATEAIKIAGTANEITTSAAEGTDDTVTLGLASQLNLSGKEILGGATPLKFEGATDDNIYTQFSFADPTGSTKTITFPNASGEVSLLGQTIEDAELASNYSGVGSCTNQFVTATNDNAAPTCSTATLASAQFASQGTTTTVLHGNAAGNPAWGLVSLTADVSGTLPAGNGGTGNAFFAVSGPATSVKTYTFPNASATVLTTNAAVTPAQGGTGANNTATTARFLRANGTNFVTSSGAASGTGSCTNQVVTATNDDAAPTCANVSSAMIADGVVASADLATANKTLARSIDIFDPTTADTNKIQFYWPAAVTLQRIACSTDAGTVSINFDERAEGTPNTAGTNTLASALQCTTTTGTTATFADATIAADVPYNLQVTATSGTPTVVRIHVKAQLN